jgi:acetyltransferase-like isoleucine patch superfamily enzyme
MLITAPLWLLARIERACGSSESLFELGSQLLSLVPGAPGIFLRRGYYAMTLDSFAWDCHLGFGTTLAHRQVIIQKGVYVGHRCTLGMLVLEEDVTIGSNVDLVSGRHQHSYSVPHLPVQKQARGFVQIRVGRNSWVGNSTVVLADVGRGCVIGAGSVVVEPVPPMSLAAGNPARVKRQLAAAAEGPSCLTTAGFSA